MGAWKDLGVWEGGILSVLNELEEEWMDRAYWSELLRFGGLGI